MGRRRAKIGDVIRICTARGYAYAQFTHRHAQLGCMLRVLPGLYSEPLLALADKVREQHLYQTFLFEEDFNEEPTTAVVGNEPVPAHACSFPLFRAGVKDPATGRVASWWLWDGQKSWPVEELTDQQRRLSLREIWNYKILAERVAEEWRPFDEC